MHKFYVTYKLLCESFVLYYKKKNRIIIQFIKYTMYYYFYDPPSPSFCWQLQSNQINFVKEKKNEKYCTTIKAFQ